MAYSVNNQAPGRAFGSADVSGGPGGRLEVIDGDGFEQVDLAPLDVRVPGPVAAWRSPSISTCANSS